MSHYVVVNPHFSNIMNNAEKIHHSLRNFLIVIIEIFLHKQVPESPVAKARKLFIARREPYQDCEERTRRDIRRELAAAIESLVTEMSHKDSDLTAIYSDLTESQRWKELCGSTQKQAPLLPEQDHFLQELAAEYAACKNKEESKSIRSKGARLTSKIKIGGSLKESNISPDGSGTDENAKTRVEAAEAIGRVRTYGDERRRLLSIVVFEYPYRVLKQYFSCSNNTIVAAKVHRIFFGRGGVPSDNLKFTREVISKDVIDDLFEFLNRDDISRPSSCRSVIVDGQETAVRYWQDSVKNIIQQYLLEFPNGVKRTYIYTHLPKNFRTNTMLAGLCNICYDDGHGNFDEIRSIVNTVLKGTACKMALDNLQVHQRYLKTEFSKQVSLKPIVLKQ